MNKTLTQKLTKLTPLEKSELERKAKEMGLTVTEWVEYTLKSQIYSDSSPRTKPTSNTHLKTHE